MPDARWNDPREYGVLDRDDERAHVYETRDRDDHDPRSALMHDLDLPRGEGAGVGDRSRPRASRATGRVAGLPSRSSMKDGWSRIVRLRPSGATARQPSPAFMSEGW
jgi:hypothetical protein